MLVGQKLAARERGVGRRGGLRWRIAKLFGVDLANRLHEQVVLVRGQQGGFEQQESLENGPRRQAKIPIAQSPLPTTVLRQDCGWR